jgi:hypothetical protein
MAGDSQGTLGICLLQYAFPQVQPRILVYSGQLLAWRKASTVATALWVLVVQCSGLREGILTVLSRKNEQYEQ